MDYYTVKFFDVYGKEHSVIVLATDKPHALQLIRSEYQDLIWYTSTVEKTGGR